MSYNMKSKSWAHTCIVAFLPLVVKQMLNDVLFLLQIDHKNNYISKPKYIDFSEKNNFVPNFSDTF